MNKLAQVVEVTDCTSITEVLNKSGTAWEPTAKPISAVKEHPAQHGDTAVQTGGFHAILRPDTMQILGICSKRFKPNSHVVHLARLDHMVRQGDLRPERVSLWDNGSLMAFQFRAPSLDAEILPGDSVSPLLTLAFYNDGKHGDMSFFADFRWACTNQLGRVSEAMDGKKRVAHRGDVHGNYEKLLLDRLLEMQVVSRNRHDAMKQMAQTQLVGPDLLHYFSSSMMSKEAAVESVLSGKDATTPEEKQLIQVLACHREDPTTAPGTVWHAFNALTRYLTHSIGRNPATRARRALIGGYEPYQDMAFQEAVKLSA